MIKIDCPVHIIVPRKTKKDKKSKAEKDEYIVVWRKERVRR